MDKFYDRERQLQQLRAITAHISAARASSRSWWAGGGWGKTRLLKEAFAHTAQPYLYLFITARTKKLWWKSCQHHWPAIECQILHPKNLLDIFRIFIRLRPRAGTNFGGR